MIKEIKNKILDLLNELVADDVISQAVKQQWGVDYLRDTKNKRYPCAILTNVADIQSEASSNRTNTRIYNIAVVLAFKTHSKADPDVIDEKVEAVMNKFDNQFTLPDDANNTTMAWIEPAISAPYQIDTVKDKVFVDLILRVRRDVELSFGG